MGDPGDTLHGHPVAGDGGGGAHGDPEHAEEEGSGVCSPSVAGKVLFVVKESKQSDKGRVKCL